MKHSAAFWPKNKDFTAERRHPNRLLSSLNHLRYKLQDRNMLHSPQKTQSPEGSNRLSSDKP